MDIFIAGPELKIGKTKESMGQWYPYYTILDQNIVVLLHIYVNIAIFLLF